MDADLLLPSPMPDPPPSSKRRSQHSSRKQRKAAVLSHCAAFTDDVVSALRAIAQDDAETLQRIVLDERARHAEQQPQPTVDGHSDASEPAVVSSHTKGHPTLALSTSSSLPQPNGTRISNKRRHSANTPHSPTVDDTISAANPASTPLTATTKRPRVAWRGKPVHVLDPARPTTLGQSVDVWIAPCIDEHTRADPLALDIEDPTTLLHYAARHNALRCMRVLVEVLGGDVRVQDAQQSMALDEAAAYDTIDAAQLLVQLGCNPHHLNNNNTTIVHSAAEQGSLTVLRWAVDELHCDVNRRDLAAGYTPLMYALDSKSNEAGRPAVIQLLVQYGADVNVTDKDGNSALLWAVSLGMDDVAKLLVRHNADLTLANNDGTTPYTLHDWDGQDYRVTEKGHNDTQVRIIEELKKDKERKRREREERLAAKLRQTQGDNDKRQAEANRAEVGLQAADDASEAKANETLQETVLRATNAENDNGFTPKPSTEETMSGGVAERVAATNDTPMIPTETDISNALRAMKGHTNDVQHGSTAHVVTSNHHQDDNHTQLNGHTSTPTDSTAYPTPPTRRPYRKRKTGWSKKPRHQSEAERRVLSAPIPVEEQRESNGGRCKRYIFQEMLNRAVEEGDYGNIDRVTALLNEWHSARRGKRYRVFPLEYDDSYPIGPMQIAVAFENDDASILQLLLDASIDYNKRTTTGFLPIHAAANVGNANSVRLLLQYGCDPNLREETDGYTALMMAADDKDGWKVVQLLLDCQSLELNAQDFHGNTALHWAVFKANVEVVRLLLSRLRVRRGTEPLNATVANKWGNAPMHYAFYRAWKSEASLRVLEMMLEAHISWKAPINKQGLAPVQLMAGKASEGGEAMQQLLRKYKVRVEEVIPKLEVSVAEDGSEVDEDDNARDPSPSPSTASSPRSQDSSPVSSVSPLIAAATDTIAQPGRARKGKKRRAPPPTVLCPATDDEIKRFKPPHTSNSKVKHQDPFLCFKALYIAADISGGVEPTPIPLVNHIDNTGLPDDFMYIAKCVTESGDEVTRCGRATGAAGEVVAQCACDDGCVDWRRCGCLGFFPLEQQKDLHYLDHFLSGKSLSSQGSGDVGGGGASSFARDFWRNMSGSSSSMAGVSSAPRPRPTRNSRSARLHIASVNGTGSAESAVVHKEPAVTDTNGPTEQSSMHSAAGDVSMSASTVNDSTCCASTSASVNVPTALPNGTSHSEVTDEQPTLANQPPTGTATTDPPTVTDPTPSSSPSAPSTSPSPTSTNHPHAHLPYAPNVLKLHEVNYLCECSDECGCPASCPNRRTQHGVSVKLQVYKTREKGWACRAMQSIKAGTFVAEYVGELLNEAESGRRLLDEYDLNGIHYMFGLKGSTYSIDPVRRGNVARLFNHSCQPNLHKLQVYRTAVRGGSGSGSSSSGSESVGVEGLGVPRMVFVAARDIVKYEELCINYDYEELDHPGGCLVCNCGSKRCRHNLV